MYFCLGVLFIENTNDSALDSEARHGWTHGQSGF